MFDFGNSLLTMNPEEQKTMLAEATPGQHKSALEMGVGFNNRNRQQQQQKRDAYHDLDRLNFTVEKENDAHDFFGQGLADWQKTVTGKEPSKDATNLKKQFDDYEQAILSTVPRGGKRHTALADSLPRIKNTFLKQGHHFALDKLDERSRTVLDKGLQRIAKGAQGAKTEDDIQAHDDAAFDLINKYVLSKARFDEKDADAMYGKYLGYAGADLDEARAKKGEDVPGSKPGFKLKYAEKHAENDTGTVIDAGGIKEVSETTDDKAAQRHNEEMPDKKQESTEDHYVLGKLSEKYETDGRGVGTVSSGKGDPGGVSYGLYQMTSKNNRTGKIGGTVEKFVKSETFPWKKDFEGLVPGSEEFTAKWKELSEKHPEEFRKSQHNYIKETHYEPTVEAVKKIIGVDVKEKSAILRDVVWSTGVQHNGPELIDAASQRVKATTKGLDPDGPEFERKVIEAIYDERATRCLDCDDKVKKGFRRRMAAEKKEALELYDKEIVKASSE